MTARPPVLRQDLVDRLRALAGGGAGHGEQPAAGLRERALAKAARPLRKVVVRLLDPPLQATLDQLRRETLAIGPPGTPQSQAEIEVLRAELASTHDALVDLGRRLDAVERRMGP